MPQRFNIRRAPRQPIGSIDVDDAAGVVEGGVVLRELERVGGDPVRCTALGRLGDLTGKGEQPLDQGALGSGAGSPRSHPPRR